MQPLPLGLIARDLCFVDHIAMWTRSRNLHFVIKKTLQADICKIEQWAQKWGVPSSGTKSKLIIFTHKKKV